MKKLIFTDSHPKKWLSLIILAGLLSLPGKVFAHPSPNAVLFLDIDPGRVTLEVQLPIPELELAWGQSLSKDPAAIIDKWGPKLKDYLLQHIHAYSEKEHPWKITITSMKMDKGAYGDSNIPYWEVNATVLLTPYPHDNTRDFFLAYDVIMHQVINHIALVSIRSDWEQGSREVDSSMGVSAIGWNLHDDLIPPLHVTLEKGSWGKGLLSMVQLGIHHIAEGTDHLLFLLALLLPAPLMVNGKKWGTYKGIRSSSVSLLKIVTAFTIGHSITLLLGALGWIHFPSGPIEVLIAISILVSAIHAIRPIFPGKEMLIAGSFGLIHGMAFAAVIARLHLSTGPMVLSILAFNIGIECMQLLVVVMTVPGLIALSKTRSYTWFRVAAGCLAGIAALVWIVERSIAL
ncbi:MAG TPA: HupE/UreJ family protein [Puia sp.]|nr:HupE/UreJ family protein [Puia sp.]